MLPAGQGKAFSQAMAKLIDLLKTNIPEPPEEPVLRREEGRHRRGPAEKAAGPPPELRGGSGRAGLLGHPGPDGHVQPARPHPRHRGPAHPLPQARRPGQGEEAPQGDPGRPPGEVREADRRSSRTSSRASGRSTRRRGPCSGAGTRSPSRPSSRAASTSVRDALPVPQDRRLPRRGREGTWSRRSTPSRTRKRRRRRQAGGFPRIPGQPPGRQLGPARALRSSWRPTPTTSTSSDRSSRPSAGPA